MATSQCISVKILSDPRKTFQDAFQTMQVIYFILYTYPFVFISPKLRTYIRVGWHADRKLTAREIALNVIHDH